MLINEMANTMHRLFAANGAEYVGQSTKKSVAGETIS